MKSNQLTAMIFAAGLGTRLKPFTLSAPKALFPVNGKPLLQRNIEYLKSFGISRFVINVHHFADKIIEFLDQNNNFGVEILISDETDELLETGGGLLKAKDLLSGSPFLVMNSDILTNLDIHKLVDFHFEYNPLVTLAVSDRESTRKLLFNQENQLCGWKDLRNNQSIIANPDFNKELAFSGIHIISPDFFDKNTFEGKFSIMKSYLELMKSERILGFQHSAKQLDVGKPDSAELAQELFK